MNRIVGIAALGAIALAGCGESARPDAPPMPQTAAQPVSAASAAQSGGAISAAAPVGDAQDRRVIARVNGEPITLSQLVQPLIESRGLPLLLNIVQLDLARQQARQSHVIVTPEDIAHEQDLTLEKMFKDADAKEQDKLADAEVKGQTELVRRLREQIHTDRLTLLDQYLREKNYSRTEYDIVVEMNAYLRKAADPLIRGKITDEMVEKEFGIEYGETAKVRYIQLSNMMEVVDAQRRLKAGEDFGDVASQMSRNPRAAAARGEMPVFSRQMPGLPESFKKVAFSLEPGQISDPLNVDGNFYILQMEKKFPPKAVKFQSVKDSLRKSMYDRVVEKTMEELRTILGARAMQTLKIDHPVLARQFEELKASHQAAIRDRQKMEQQWKKERPAQKTSPATAPSASQPIAPATAPSNETVFQP